jgi:aminoglycoside/choline kinase family phosphotransferase
MRDAILDQIRSLALQFERFQNPTITALPISGSSRQYFRIVEEGFSCIATWNESAKENQTFIDYTKALLKIGVSVPNIYLISNDHRSYLQEDLGDRSVLDWIYSMGDHPDTEQIEVIYRRILTDLITIQEQLPRHIDISSQHAHASFDHYQVGWDLNYFKYNYLKVHIDPIDEFQLEKEFEVLAQHVVKNSYSTFMYRDFQARNIMLKEDCLYYIDYQGGKHGPALYDVVSLLFQAKANLNMSMRESLLQFYIQERRKKGVALDENPDQQFWDLALVRCLQVLGAYGFRGYLQQKSHFLDSIPFALSNLSMIMDRCTFINQLPYLKQLLTQLTKPE